MEVGLPELQVQFSGRLDPLQGCHEIAQKVLKSSPWAHHFKDRSSFEIERSFLNFTVVS
jgi:hypothetical protein